MRKAVVSFILLIAASSLMADEIPRKYWDMFRKDHKTGYELTITTGVSVIPPGPIQGKVYEPGVILDVRNTWDINGFKLGVLYTFQFIMNNSYSAMLSYPYFENSVFFIFGYKFHIAGFFSIAPYIAVGAVLYAPGYAITGTGGTVNVMPAAWLSIDFIFEINSYIDIVLSVGDSFIFEWGSYYDGGTFQWVSIFDVQVFGRFQLGVTMKF